MLALLKMMEFTKMCKINNDINRHRLLFLQFIPQYLPCYSEFLCK